MATYSQIQKYVKQVNGFVPKTCWIADVKNDYGLTNRMAPNRHSIEERKQPCPEKKRDAIISALKHFKMV